MNTETTPEPARTAIELCERAFQALPSGRRFNLHWSIAPRFTSGSPAMLSLGEVARVAIQEQEAHANCLTGVFGEELKAKAERPDPLANIAYGRWEKGGKVFRYDLLTGKTFEEPKRLEWSERERVRWLRNLRATHERSGARLCDSLSKELAALEHRLELHRETVS